MKLSQKMMPYISAVNAYVHENRVPFHMPGHKQGFKINNILKNIWGDSFFKYDLTEVDGLDYINAPSGVLLKAQILASQAFKTKATFFLVNGSTVGNQASIMTLVKENKRILIPRNSHQSTYAGLILSGATPVYAQPTLHEESGFFPVTSSTEVSRLLKTYNIQAVHITSPTHIGFTSNIKDIRDATLKAQIPLIVDEAHGSHFQFHPDLPTSAIEYKADLIVHSIHKTLGSLTQTSMLHIGNTQFTNGADMQKILRMLHTSSPSTILLMSLDAARQQIATNGYSLLTRALELSRYAREHINQMGVYRCYGKEVEGVNDIAEVDETKLLNALKDILKKRKRTIAKDENLIVMPEIPKLILTPRKAFFAKKKSIPLARANGKICGEFVIPFPPDIPVIIPGEKFTKDIIEYINFLKKNNAAIIGTEDPTIDNIKIITH